MTTWARLIRAEVRKLSSTRIVVGFVFVLVVISSLTGVAVLWGTDMDGSMAFIASELDQRSLVAFANNAIMGAGLFGAIAVAREYGHATVVPTFLASPRRHRAVVAQYAAVAVVGSLLGLLGAGLTIGALVVTLPTTDYGFMLSGGAVLAVLASSAFGGAAGATLGAGIGAVVRNTGGAVTGAVLLLFIAPPLIVQLASSATSWVPATLASVLSGVTHEVSRPAATAALALWALVPALIGLVVVQRRDVV